MIQSMVADDFHDLENAQFLRIVILHFAELIWIKTVDKGIASSIPLPQTDDSHAKVVLRESSHAVCEVSFFEEGYSGHVKCWNLDIKFAIDGQNQP